MATHHSNYMKVKNERARVLAIIKQNRIAQRARPQAKKLKSTQ